MGAGGGGGAAGPNGPGGRGGSNANVTQSGSGGGGGANGGANAANPTTTAGTAGGAGKDGSGGGTVSGGTASANLGGGGGGCTGGGTTNGGPGAIDNIWTDGTTTRGPSGGGGGGSGRSSGGNGGAGGGAIASVSHGGGGGGGGQTGVGTQGVGASGRPGLIVFIYSDTALPTGFARCGDPLFFNVAGGGNSGTVSTTITVPADAELALVGWASFEPTPGYFSSGSLTLTKGGVDTAMTPATSLMDAGVSGVQGMMWWMVLPDTGTNKSLKWDWLGTTAQYTPPHLVTITFWKGVDTTSPIRHASAAKGSTASAVNTPTLTAQSGDLIVAFFGGFNDAVANDGEAKTWNNLSLFTQCPNASNHDGAWAVGAPSGNTTVGLATEWGWGEGGITAVVIKPPVTTITGALADTEDPDVAAFTGSIPEITQTGSTLAFNISTANAGTVSSTITVPADAELMLVGVSSYSSTNGFFSGSSMTFTKGGVDTAMTSVGAVGADTSTGYAGPIFWMALPDTGTNKSLKWDWQGTSIVSDAPLISITFWKGVDTSAPIRAAAGGASGSAPYTSSSLAAQAGDLIVAHVGAFCTSSASEGSADSWSAPLALVTNVTHYVSGDAAWAKGKATGAQTVSMLTETNWDDGSICAVAIKPAPTGYTGTLADTEDPDVLAATGTVRWVAVLAETDDPDVAALTGTVRWAATLATTEAVDVLAATGTVRWVANLAAIESVDVLAATGTVSWQATLAAPETADVAALVGAVRWAAILATGELPDVAALTGAVSWQAALATTEAPDVAAFTGNVFTPVTGTLGTIEAIDVAAFNGSVGAVGITGTLAAPEPADVAAFTGGIYGTGTLAAPEPADIASLTGTVRWVANLATVEAPDVAALTGAVRWAATLASSEAPDVAALAGSVRWAAILTAAETLDVGAFLGAVRWTATLAAPELPDQAAFTGGIYASGPLAVGELPDTATFTGGIYASGPLAVTEPADTYAGLGTAFGAGVGANLAAVEAPDAAAFTGQVTGVAGTLATGEAPDSAAFIGAVRWAATLASTEAADAAAFLATVRWVATLAVVEAKDVAALAGTTRWAATLASSEAPDVGAFTGATGALAASATLETTEAPDRAAFTGNTTTVAVLEAREAPDRAAFTGQFVSDVVLDTREAPDAVLFTEAPVSIQEAPGSILARDQMRVRDLASSDERVRALKYPMPRPRDLINNNGQRERVLDGRRVRDLVGA
jgi:hypothetical protein